MYSVFSNGKEANEKSFPELKGNGWTKNCFNTFEEALEYANEWLGCDNLNLKVNEPYDYSGYGDIIEIRYIG